MVAAQPLGSAGELDLKETFCCGQCFRWVPTTQQPGGWQGVADGHFSTIWKENGVVFSDCASEDVDFWRNYLALDTDWAALCERLSQNQCLATCVQTAPGLHVLRQPFFETLCSFIISQNNNIPRIRGIVERLCRLCGEPLAGGQFAFPTAQALVSLAEADLTPLRAGWRSGYLLDAAHQVASGAVCEKTLSTLPTAQARALLMTIRGVGPKVADCVLLYSLGRWEVCPMDVWMKRAMNQCFPHGMPRCAKGVEGIAQQYIFVWARQNLPHGSSK